MRVAILDYWHKETHGGRQVFVDVLVSELINRGHEVALISKVAREPFDCALSGQISQVELLEPRELKSKRIFRELEKLGQFFDEFNPQVIHLQSVICPSKRLIDILASKRNSKFAQVLTIHDVTELKAVKQYFSKSQSISNIEAFVSPSVYIQNRMKEFDSSSSNFLIEHGERAEPLPNEISEGRFVYCGRLIVEKGILHLLSAWRRIYSDLEAFELHIYGDGPLYPVLERLISDYKLSDRTFMHGAISNSVVRNLHSVNSVLIQPSLVPESFCLSVLEAMSQGSACIVSNTGALPELIRKGEDGHVFPTHDIDSLALHMKSLALNSELRKQFGDSAKKRVATHYTLDKTIDKYEELYNYVNL